MWAVKELVTNKDAIEAELRQRDPTVSLDSIVGFYDSRRTIQKRLDAVHGNIKSLAKDARHDEVARATIRSLREQERSITAELSAVADELTNALLYLPNRLQPDVPRSPNKEDKDIIHIYGAAPHLPIDALDHIALGRKHSLLDFDRAAKIAGSGFPLYRGVGARLEWGLINFMLERAQRNGFEFMLLPLFNSTESLTASGNLPRFADELYSTEDGWHAIPTAEVPITNLYRGEILDVAELPLRVVSYSPCFRREAGGHGKLARGLMRMHQFNKVETYSFCSPEQAKDEHQNLVRNGESILEDLGLHYRLANLPSSDLAQQSSQTFDIEVWLPKAEMFSEVSSASNCTDFQARRANIRFRGHQENQFVHTLNCSALATPRVMIALLETYQQLDGSIVIPDVLRPYVGVNRIE